MLSGVSANLAYAHILSFVLESPWAIIPSHLDTLVAILAERVSGRRPSADEIDERLAAAGVFGVDAASRERDSALQMYSNVAIIPIRGTIVPRASAFEEMSGAVSTERLISQLRAAAADQAVARVFLDIDSPGGNVWGVQEAAAEIRATAAAKPVLAHANFLSASAGYWLGSQATEFLASPSAWIGSIGVIASHQSFAVALERLGVETKLITAGKFKGEGHPAFPLADEAVEARQAQVNHHYEAFVADVAKGRRTTPGAVRGGFGEGRVLVAAEALAAGMIDRIATASEALQRAANPRARIGSSAEAELEAWESESLEPPAPVAAAASVSAPEIVSYLAERLREQRQEG